MRQKMVKNKRRILVKDGLKGICVNIGPALCLSRCEVIELVVIFITLIERVRLSLTSNPFYCKQNLIKTSLKNLANLLNLITGQSPFNNLLAETNAKASLVSF